MTTAQRWLLIISLGLIALIMHFNWCEWSFGSPSSGDVLIGWRTERQYSAEEIRADPALAQFVMRNYYGCHTRYRTLGVFAGFVTPWVLLTAALFLWLGHARAARKHRGACIHCGYNLSFKYASGCPECGWNRRDTPA